MGCCIPNQYDLGLRIALMLFKRVNRQRYRQQEEEVMLLEREERVRLNSAVPQGGTGPSPAGYPASAFRH